MNEISINAYAKTNLFLRILSRETSGFHTIETLFILIDLFDTVSVEKTDAGIDLVVEGADTGPSERNLAYRAAKKILDTTGWRFGVRIQLKKRIPVQGGLGGGSSDCAAVLRAVNQLAGDVIPNEILLGIAAELGSDVPFFLSRTPYAIGWGRGERLLQLSPPPSLPALVVVPDFGISTKYAYDLVSQMLDEKIVRSSAVHNGAQLSEWRYLSQHSENDFEKALFPREQRLQALYSKIVDFGPLVARLSGSGSAMIALFETDGKRDRAAKSVEAEGYEVYPTRTLDICPSSEQLNSPSDN